MPNLKTITIDTKADPQMSEAFKKLTPALQAALEQLKKMGNLSLGLNAGTESFTQSIKQVQTAMDQLSEKGPLTLKEIEESEFMTALKNIPLAKHPPNDMYSMLTSGGSGLGENGFSKKGKKSERIRQHSVAVCGRPEAWRDCLGEWQRESDQRCCYGAPGAKGPEPASRQEPHDDAQADPVPGP